MINYIRQKSPPLVTVQSWTRGQVPWLNDSYMKPTMADDGLLQFDIESLESCPQLKAGREVKKAECRSHGDTSSQEENHPAKKVDFVIENGDMVTIPAAAHNELIARMQYAEARVMAAEDALRRAMADIQTLRQAAQNLVMCQPAEIPPSHEAIQNMSIADDSSYIDCYDHFAIHHEMLQDRIRTESYRDSMYDNRDLLKDKVVLDVGCGTGILSLFAAKAGAKKVIGVDMSDTIYQAMDIVRENNLEDTITLIKGRLEDAELPEEKVDIIVSEWMGYFLLFESMLDSVLYARDRYLAPDGVVLPDHCRICLTGADDSDLHKKLFGFWDDVYGFRMSCMKSAVMKEGINLTVNEDKVSTDHCVLKEIDVCTCSTKDLEFVTDFSLVAQRDTDLTMLVGYFDIAFTKVKNEIQFSTGPMSPSTHWKQTLFMLRERITLVKGETLTGSLTVKKGKNDPRSLDVIIITRDQKNSYLLD